jgi:RND family efflux transporter MFP subunit
MFTMIKSKTMSFAILAAWATFSAALLLGSDSQHSLHGRFALALAPTQRAEAADQANPGGGKILYYQDPMHPWYHSDKPGIAPDCGMKLVPVYASEAPRTALPPGSVEISPARQQLMGVTTAKAEYRALDQTVRSYGQVKMDETRLVHVHVRTNGWIQKVFVDYTWQQVKQGDPLFTFYSPDLLATEQEYLLALRARDSLARSSFPEIATAGVSLLDAARRRLELWDLTDAQIHEIETSGKPTRDIPVYSPASGYVVDRKAFPNQYVTPEMDIYQMADLSSIWAEGEIYESDAPAVSLGQEAVLTTEALANAVLRGRLIFISPSVKPDTRTITVRTEFPNPGVKLKPGMFVNVELHRGLGRRLTVPVDAVMDSGTHQRVFVDRGKGVFEPRTVTVGPRSGDYAVILSGLRAGELVVRRANFLIDSESNLREAITGMAGMPGMSGMKQAGQTPMPPAAKAPTQHDMPGMPGMPEEGKSHDSPHH